MYHLSPKCKDFQAAVPEHHKLFKLFKRFQGLEYYLCNSSILHPYQPIKQAILYVRE